MRLCQLTSIIKSAGSESQEHRFDCYWKLSIRSCQYTEEAFKHPENSNSTFKCLRKGPLTFVPRPVCPYPGDCSEEEEEEEGGGLLPGQFRARAVCQGVLKVPYLFTTACGLLRDRTWQKASCPPVLRAQSSPTSLTTTRAHSAPAT